MDVENDEASGEQIPKTGKQSNVLQLWGNERTMNLNTLILTNIQSSHYFKVNLYELKTYHEVIDEIYYQVSHLEPWEKGSRRTSGQTGMCGGVRGVGAGGIVSTAYCLLYKLFTLKLTRKQLNGLLTHCDSPYIRALGFMYIRYTQHPQTLLDWFESYLEDEEEIDPKAGGGQLMTIGQMLRQWLIKLDWFSTLFPRIPVPIQQKIQKYLEQRFPNGILSSGPPASVSSQPEVEPPTPHSRNNGDQRMTAVRRQDDYSDHHSQRSHSRDLNRRDKKYQRSRSRERVRSRSRDVAVNRYKNRSRDRSREKYRERNEKNSDRDRKHDKHHYHKHKYSGDHHKEHYHSKSYR